MRILLSLNYKKYGKYGDDSDILISPYFNNFDSNHFEVKMQHFLLETGVIKK